MNEQPKQQINLDEFKNFLKQNIEAILYKNIFEVADDVLIDKTKLIVNVMMDDLKSKNIVKDYSVILSSEATRIGGSITMHMVDENIPSFTIEFNLDIETTPEKVEPEKVEVITEPSQSQENVSN